MERISVKPANVLAPYFAVNNQLLEAYYHSFQNGSTMTIQPPLLIEKKHLEPEMLGKVLKDKGLVSKVDDALRMFMGFGDYLLVREPEAAMASALYDGTVTGDLIQTEEDIAVFNYNITIGQRIGDYLSPTPSEVAWDVFSKLHAQRQSALMADRAYLQHTLDTYAPQLGMRIMKLGKMNMLPKSLEERSLVLFKQLVQP